MDLAMPTYALAAALATVTPHLETEPYVGDPPVVACQYSIDSRFISRIPSIQTDAGTICRWAMGNGITEGMHAINGRYVFRVDGKEVTGPASDMFYFRLYRTPSGATFWTWESAVVCEADCVSQ